ncbi:MAG: isocitrate/isopropylmalate family dehydrogenase, partial [Longimicrobiales bacterium]|nr:isocitrate/isopropylmalate family dehydrogenase [Longimicrobiales bacterium]
MSRFHVVVLPGDGVGPDVSEAALVVLRAVAERYDHELQVDEHPVGFTAWEQAGAPIDEEALEACR